MSTDSYVQVSTDGSGKQIDMALTATAAGATIYRQRAEVVGNVSDTLNQLLELQIRQLACMRAILSYVANGAASEDDFVQDSFN